MIVKEFSKYCQSCGGIQSYTSKNELQRATKNNTHCRSCHNKSVKYNKRLHKGIPIAWFDDKKRKALARGKEFSIDIKYIWYLYLRQNKVCALSGLPLDFDKDTSVSMVSIDRINNDKGYVKRNIQLLHKTINFMKYVYTQKEFIKMCKLVAQKNSDEKIS